MRTHFCWEHWGILDRIDVPSRSELRDAARTPHQHTRTFVLQAVEVSLRGEPSLRRQTTQRRRERQARAVEPADGDGVRRVALRRNRLPVQRVQVMAQHTRTHTHTHTHTQTQTHRRPRSRSSRSTMV